VSKTQRDAETSTASDEVSEGFVGRWNHLVSTTNWEKGKIIFQWRKDLEARGAAGSEMSDEAWSRRVGNISPQHVGRLRRVSARFNKARKGYSGLYWSHFQSAVEWEDAELWLEGALQNRWSVAQMRFARWEAIGAPADQKPLDQDIITAELDEDRLVGINEKQLPSARASIAHDPASGEEMFTPDYGDETKAPREQVIQILDAGSPHAPMRPFAELASLPADVGEAFESFKLAILHHKMHEWEEVSREDILSTLEALKDLAVAP
jgi:hypothetical protein